MRRAGILLSGSLLASMVVVAAPSAQGAESYEECMANTQGVETWGCYDLQVAPSSGPNAVVRLKWNLFTGSEGFNNSAWKGGYVFTRWPVEGQWKKYPPLKAVYIPGAHEGCNDERISPASCRGVFSGASGEANIDFSPNTAGYVYEVYSHDYICSTDGASCGPSGGSANRYVFVLKAVQYKDKNGKVVKTAKCPSKKKRSSACTPAATALITNNIGGGVPVPVPDGN
jgi:hypothetical protein